MKRGECWWARLPGRGKTRPVVLVTRAEAIARRQFVTVALVTTRQRAIPTEVALGSTEGLPRPCVANCDDLQTVPKSWLLERIGALGPAKTAEFDDALRFALGLG